jgi:hypothetical protein
MGCGAGIIRTVGGGVHRAFPTNPELLHNGLLKALLYKMYYLHMIKAAAQCQSLDRGQGKAQERCQNAQYENH